MKTILIFNKTTSDNLIKFEYIPLLKDIYDIVDIQRLGDVIKSELIEFLNKLPENHTILVFNNKVQKKLETLNNNSIGYTDNINYKTLNIICLPILNCSPQSSRILKDCIYYIQFGDYSIKYLTIHKNTSKNTLDSFLSKLDSYKGICAFDIETNNMLDLNAELVSIAFTFKNTSIVIKDTYTNEIKQLIIDIFTILKSNKIKIIAHNATFEVTQLINILFIDKQWNPLKLNEGISIFEYIQDTQLLVYAAYNNTFLNILNLKQFGYKKFGNYGINFSELNYEGEPCEWDISEEFLKYNVIDTIVTYDLYESLINKEYISKPYLQILQPSILPISKMMLTGLPIDYKKTLELKDKIKENLKSAKYALENSNLINSYEKTLRTSLAIEATKKLKKLKKTSEDFKNINFNPNSGKQVSELLYKYLKLPYFIKTPTNMPSSNGVNLRYTFNLLKRQTETKDIKEVLIILKALIDLSELKSMESTFIKAFLKTKNYQFNLQQYPFLRGNLKLGGTVSGRLSASKPNLQNLPSSSTYGKSVKQMFSAPPGYIICSADFSSLEDRILTIQTQAVNKLKIYKEGYDGHCVNAFAYFKNKMPKIINTLESINSIKELYPKLRNDSKPPTFALAYLGTEYTLETNCGFSKEEALHIYNSYQKTYPEVGTLQRKLKNIYTKKGYIELPYGLRLWTVLDYFNKSSYRHTDPRTLNKEYKTVCNAFTQSWGILMNRALIATENRLKSSPYGLDIHILNTVHDAGYFLVKLDARCIKELNDILISEMSFNNMEGLYDSNVPITAEMDIGYNLYDVITVPNNAELFEIQQILNKL